MLILSMYLRNAYTMVALLDWSIEYCHRIDHHDNNNGSFVFTFPSAFFLLFAYFDAKAVNVDRFWHLGVIFFSVRLTGCWRVGGLKV